MQLGFWTPVPTEIWFDDDLWASKYVYEIKKWNMFYKLYDELIFHDMFERSMNSIWC
jgi:hypothetical protein